MTQVLNYEIQVDARTVAFISGVLFTLIVLVGSLA